MRSSSSWSAASATGRPIRPRVAVDVEHDLLDPARTPAGDVDVLDLDVALRQPRDGLGDVAPERRLALDASAHGVMDLGHARERPDERVDLSAHQARRRTASTGDARAGAGRGRAATPAPRRALARTARAKAFHGSAQWPHEPDRFTDASPVRCAAGGRPSAREAVASAALFPVLERPPCVLRRARRSPSASSSPMPRSSPSCRWSAASTTTRSATPRRTSAMRSSSRSAWARCSWRRRRLAGVVATGGPPRPPGEAAA